MENARCTLHDSKRDKSLLLSMIKKEIRLFTAWYSENELLLLFALDATQTIFKHFCLFMSKYNSFPFAGFNH